jgi:very-short-patch-repair endonuclease
MDQFPSVLIPPALRRVKAELPPLPLFLEKPPKLPPANPQMINLKLMAIEIGVVVAIGTLLTQWQSIIGGFILLIGMIGILIHAVIQLQNHSRRTKAYNQEMETYYQALAAFCQKEVAYEQEVAAIRSPEKIAELQYPRLLQVLSKTATEDGQRPLPATQVQYTAFGQTLDRAFPGKIHQGIYFEGADITQPYHPDFAYIDPAVNLRIDIEVDEPYANLSLEPTHYIRSWHDDSWNEFFLKKGWLVIRFSHQQVTQTPESCCRAIAQEICNLLSDPLILKPFEHIPVLQPAQRWTQQEAQQMAAIARRQQS